MLATRQAPDALLRTRLLRGAVVVAGRPPRCRSAISATAKAASCWTSTIDVTARRGSCPTDSDQIGFTSWLPGRIGHRLSCTRRSSASAATNGQLWLRPYPEGRAPTDHQRLVDYRQAARHRRRQLLTAVGQEFQGELYRRAAGRIGAERMRSERYRRRSRRHPAPRRIDHHRQHGERRVAGRSAVRRRQRRAPC